VGIWLCIGEYLFCRCWKNCQIKDLVAAIPNQWGVTGEWTFEREVWDSLLTETADHAANCYFNIPMLRKSVLTLLIIFSIFGLCWGCL
jgi:hypothetical protein